MKKFWNRSRSSFQYELDPEKISTFWEWLNLQDMELAQWELFEDGTDDHHHELVALTPEQTNAILDAFLAWKEGQMSKREPGKHAMPR